MPTVLRIDGYEIMIYVHEHLPEHVHAWARGCELVVNLNCAGGYVSIRENNGMKSREIATILRIVQLHRDVLCEMWKDSMETFDEYLDRTLEDQISAANERSRLRLLNEPHIEKAHYDTKLRRIIVSLSNHAWFAFRPEDAQGLEHGTPAELKKIEISPSTFGLHFPLLDAQFDITLLMQGNFGSSKWKAARLAAAGEASGSAAKVTVARANGKPASRPRKIAVK